MITRKTISEQVFDHILEEIRCGNFKPGDKLTDERSLSESLGVSRVPLREAIKSLTQMGILVTKHGDGTFVNTNTSDVMTNAMSLFISMEDSLILEFAEVRRMMEREAARLASIHATDEEIQEMIQLCNERDGVVKGEKDPDVIQEKLNDLDKRLHMSIAHATHNSVFHNFLDSIRNTIHLHQIEASHRPDMLLKANAAHRKIIEAIAARDEEAAAAAMEEHIMDIEEALLVLIEQDE